MAKSRKHPKYDPLFAETNAKARLAQENYAKVLMDQLIPQLTKTAKRLLGSGVSCCSVGLDKKGVEIVLVADLGLQTLLKLRKLMKKVPKNIPDRHKLITSYLGNSISEEKCLTCIKLVEECVGVTPEWTSDSSSIPSTSTAATESLRASRIPGDHESGLYHVYRFLTPPVACCINEACALNGSMDSLTSHHGFTVVTVYSLSGPEVGLKYALKCRKCSFIYNYAMFGKKNTVGERFYAWPRDLVEVSDVTYCEREIFKIFCSLSLHCWVSFSGFAEAYTESCTAFTKQHQFEEFWRQREESTPELTRKLVSQMFYNGEIEKEARDKSFPYSESVSWLFGLDKDRQYYMQYILSTRALQIYHREPNKGCVERGCGKCWAMHMDGNWKLCFPHCMFPVVCKVPNLPLLNFPSVCTGQPKAKSAFCITHHSKAQGLGYPTDVNGFLHFCGARKTAEAVPNAEQENEVGDCIPMKHIDIARDDEEGGILKKAFTAMSGTVADVSLSLLESQGVLEFISDFPSVATIYMEESSHDNEPRKHGESLPTQCRKDLGDSKKLHLWSRGHIFLVRPCGHIDMWRPIYRLIDIIMFYVH